MKPKTLLAPIVLFAYRRLAHTKQTIQALQDNFLAKKSEIFIYSDAPKKPEVVNEVNEVRKYLKTVRGFKKANIIERKKNLGLANSIIDGVSTIVNQYGKVIVIEDDLVTSKYFLNYMNHCLKLYEKDSKVASISAYIYPIAGLPESFFIKGADCWGWATWKRAWRLFEADGKKLLSELEKKNLVKEFDFNNSYDYTQMLKDQILAKNDSWAIRWYASVFLKDKLTLYPSYSFVQNIGIDNSGEHCGKTDKFDIKKLNSTYKVSKIDTIENKEARKKIEGFYQFIKPKPLHPVIIFKKKISKKIKHVYERDTVVFDTIQYTWALLSGLMFVAAKSKGSLKLIDFGGSLGSTYFQNKKFLNFLKTVSWNVVEQKNYVTVGKKEFSDNRLHFYYDVKSCFKKEGPNVILFSSVLQYLEKPYELLDIILQYNFKFILIDRTPFHKLENRDKIKIQVVPPSIYKASYPCWFFDKRKFIQYFTRNGYKIMEEFDGIVDGFGEDYEFKGFVMIKNSNV